MYYLRYYCYYILYVNCYIIYLIIYKERTKTNREGRAKAQTEREVREEQGKGCRRHPRQFLASLPFRLPSAPSEPSPASQTVAPQTKEREERATCPALVGCHRHHIATTSPPIDQQPDGQRRGPSVILPASHLPLRQVVRVWQRTSQGRRSPPAHLVDPFHPAWEGVRIYPVKF